MKRDIACIVHSVYQPGTVNESNSIDVLRSVMVCISWDLATYLSWSA